ncbi:MAG: hypothetical protein KKE77_00360 [Alphaproteobacteria bacterium]|nr:hypothetical protein [Alphaproteobacteria bacterium]
MGASRTTKPLIAHPAFPVVVALWFAALLGLGTFVVPPANFEGLVVGTGLDSLLPAAAPPLGDTARLAISAVAALLGALLGLAIAARIRRSEDAPQARAAEGEPASDSPWLADGDDNPEPDFAPDRSPGETPLDDGRDSVAPGSVPSRLARRRSMSAAEAPVVEDEPEEEPERILHASALPSGEGAEADPIGSEQPEADAADGYGYEGDGSEDEDLQRFAADRLVAGLPRVQRRNFDDDPLEDWSHAEPDDETAEPEPEHEPEPEPVFDSVPAPLATEPPIGETEEPDFEEPGFEGPDFDAGEPAKQAEYEEAEYEELPAEPEPAPRIEADLPPPAPAEAGDWSPAASDSADEPSSAPHAQERPEPAAAPRDFSTFSLSELVARFDAALAAQHPSSSSGDPEPAETQADDPVIAFLRREADRDRGAPGEPPAERSDDPRAGLRNALDKLDRVSRKS